ncbi:DNA-processing protein DprA [Alteromonas portus]|uniref:DNA-processing protein DprA n=1 Tax=Alteromonas portus TaxID=2565549 RepID=A0A4U0ZF77_9ALTE|nr:DNA-processing protein DprA [Alteromonas portus]TKB01993.1 DNA-processing protein DprA [Alteromonas portus]
MSENNKTKDIEYWQSERVAFCALQSLHGVGFKTLHKLVRNVDSLKAFIKNSSADEFAKTLRIKLEPTLHEVEHSWKAFQQQLWADGISLLKKLAKDKVQVVFSQESLFPEKLRAIDKPPLWLFVQGSLENLNKASVALVGSRQCSQDGYWLSKYIHSILHKKNLVTVSGLAEGIDQSVHYESLRFGIPTVAVLGTGIDSNFPKGSEILRADILANGGTVVTEYLVGQSYSASNFVQRNRIQAALSDCLIPLEWKIKSGTAHTVNFAKDYGRLIAMLCLPDSDENNPERKFIESYQKGMVFQVPHQTADVEEYILSLVDENKPPKTSSEPVNPKKEQFKLDL